MGGGCSAPVDRESSDVKTSSTKWKKRQTKKETRQLYEMDGSIPVNCADELLALRVYLDDPTILQAMGKFAIARDCFQLLMCWADLLEYKSIHEDAFDLQISKAQHIYHKYLTEKGRKSMSRINISEEQAQLINEQLQRQKIEDAEGLSSHMFDKMQQDLLVQIHDDVFYLFKATSAFRGLVRNMKTDFNQIDVDDFEYFEPLGQGSFGFVIHCRKKSTGKHYAMKVQTKMGLLQNFSDCPERVSCEKDAVASCVHPFIISMDYAFQTNSLVLMAMDLGTAGTLLDALNKCENIRMPVERVQFYSAEIVLALAHIHRLGMIYRDLKPENVLLNEDGHIQLVDLGGIVDVGGKVQGYHDNEEALMGGLFAPDYEYQSIKPCATQLDANEDNLSFMERGASNLGNLLGRKMPKQVSKVNSISGRLTTGSGVQSSTYRMALPPKLKRATSIMGTDGFMAPEMLVMSIAQTNDVKGYTCAVDYWALGITMHLLLTAKLPFDNSTVVHLAVGKQPPITKESASLQKHLHSVPLAAAEIIADFLNVNEEQRLGSGKNGLRNIRNHVFFAGIKFNLLAQKHLVPPFVPMSAGQEKYCDNPHKNFEAMMQALGMQGWLKQSIYGSGQANFTTWDFVSPSILKLEMGIEQEIELSNANFKQTPEFQFVDNRIAHGIRRISNALAAPFAPTSPSNAASPSKGFRGSLSGSASEDVRGSYELSVANKAARSASNASTAAVMDVITQLKKDSVL